MKAKSHALQHGFFAGPGPVNREKMNNRPVIFCYPVNSNQPEATSGKRATKSMPPSIGLGAAESDHDSADRPRHHRRYPATD